MAIIQISALDIHIARASDEFFSRVVEADIREAHGEVISRVALSGVPEYVYEALVRSLDEDQKSIEAEVEEQYRLLDGEDAAPEN